MAHEDAIERMDCLPARTARVSALEFVETFHKTPALVSYRVRCGKSGCACSHGELHGPYWFLRWRDGARQRRRYVKASELDTIRIVIERRRGNQSVEKRALLTARTNLRGLRQWLRQIEREWSN